jgi:predicted nucleic acid-binding protein
MNYLFLDASYILALEIANEQNHQVAFSYWQSLDRNKTKLVTTSYIFDEVVTFLNSRRLHNKAVEVGNKLLNSRSIQFIHVDDSLFLEAWLLFQKYDDKSYSLTDCISFLVMEKLKIKMALTFDNHFNQAGFIKLP